MDHDIFYDVKVRAAAVKEHEGISWDEPNEANGYFPHGLKGSSWWLIERRRPKPELIVEVLEHDTPSNMNLPKQNPLTHAGVTDAEWAEAREIMEEKYRQRALERIERFFEEGRFLEGKRLEDYADAVELEDLEDYARTARDAANAFDALSKELRRGSARGKLISLERGE